jgi:CRISPR-associated protein Csm3
MSELRLTSGKAFMEATMECCTGLHIGASRDSISIGGVDAPVIRDPITNQPYVPGSSLKGRLRCLLEKAAIPLQLWSCTERVSRIKGNVVIRRHECKRWDQAVKCPVCRLFGSTGEDEKPKSGDSSSTGIKFGSNFPARIIVRDAKMKNHGIFEDIDALFGDLLYRFAYPDLRK